VEKYKLKRMQHDINLDFFDWKRRELLLIFCIHKQYGHELTLAAMEFLDRRSTASGRSEGAAILQPLFFYLFSTL
jgi:hypothetical protein